MSGFFIPTNKFPSAASVELVLEGAYFNCRAEIATFRFSESDLIKLVTRVFYEGLVQNTAGF